MNLQILPCVKEPEFLDVCLEMWTSRKYKGTVFGIGSSSSKPMEDSFLTEFQRRTRDKREDLEITSTLLAVFVQENPDDFELNIVV